MKNTFIILLSLLCSYSYAQNVDTIATKSGLKYYYIEHGEGLAAKSGWVMITHYIGSFEDGDKFDSSRDRNDPFVFNLNKGQVIKGMDEGVSLMKIGDRIVFIIPSELAYGEKGAGEVIPPNSTLIFDVELLDMKEKSLFMALDKTLRSHKNGKQDSTLYFKDMYSQYKELKKANFEGLYYGESDLNRLGYSVLSSNPKEAAKIFSLNVDFYPESSNAYDSLGEAYMELANNKKAIKNYQRSLELDPENNNASEMILKMEAL